MLRATTSEPRVIKADLWSPKPLGAVLVIPVNGNLYSKDASGPFGKVIHHAGEAIMQRGIAYQAAKQYPDLPKIWGRILEEQGRKRGHYVKYAPDAGCHVAILKFDPLLIAFPTQWDVFDRTPFKDQSNLGLIERSARELRDMANKYKWENVYLPLVGTGTAGLQWKDVMERIGMYLDDRFIICVKAGVASASHD